MPQTIQEPHKIRSVRSNGEIANCGIWPNHGENTYPFATVDKPKVAFPIAQELRHPRKRSLSADRARAAASFNPAYVRSASPQPQHTRRGPHITLQIPESAFE